MKKKIKIAVIILLLAGVVYGQNRIVEVERAKVLIKKGKLREALKELERADKRGKKDWEINFLKGSIYYREKKYYYAIKELDKSIEKRGRNEEAYILKYKIYDDMEEYDKSIEVLEELKSISKNKYLIYYKIGDEYWKKYVKEKGAESREKAIENLKAAVEENKRLYAGYIYLGKIYYEGKEYGKGLEMYKKAKEVKGISSGREAERGIKICGYLYNKEEGDKNFKEGKYIEAIARYKEALKYGGEKYELLVKLGNSYYLIGKYKEGLKAVARAKKKKRKATEAIYLSGIIKYKMGDLKGAEREFEISIQENPHNAQAYYYLGKIKIKEGDYVKGEKYIKDAIRIKSREAKYHRDLGFLYLKRREYKKGVEELEIAENLNESYDLGEYIKLGKTLEALKEGDKLYEEGKYEEAVKRYEEALELEEREEIYISKASALIKMKRYKEALESLKKAREKNPELIEIYEKMGYVYRKLRKYEEADKIYRELKVKMKGNVEIYYKSGMSYEERGEYDKAIEMYKEGLKIKKSEKKLRERIGYVYYVKGVKKYNEGRYEEAEKEFIKGKKWGWNKELLAEGIEKCEMQLRVGKINEMIKKADRLYEREKYRSAARIYRKIREIKPELVEAGIKEARCYMNAGDYETSEILLKEMLKKGGGDRNAVEISLAELYIEEGKIELAKKRIESLGKADGDYRVDYIKGRIYEKEGEIGKAIKSYKKAKAKNKKDINVRIDLGNIYYKAGEYTKAEKEYVMILKMRPGDLVGTYNLGVIYLKRGEYGKALKMFKSAERRLAGYAPLYFHMGKSYYYLKKYSKALRYLKRAVKKETKIVYIWGLANVYMKLIDYMPGKAKKIEYKKKAIELLKVCMENKENNRISLLARKAILKLEPDKKLLYAYRLPIDIRYNPVVIGKYSYVYSDIRKSYLKIEKESEDIIWEYKEPAPPSCQFQVGRYFYFGTENGYIKAVDKENGELKWKYKGYATEIDTVNRGVIIREGSKENESIVAIENGIRKWEEEIDKGEVVCMSGEYIVKYSEKWLEKINSKSGEVEWKNNYDNK